MSTFYRRTLACFGAFTAVAMWAGVAHAATVQVQPGDDLHAAVAGLQPGDELVLADGTYTLSSRFGVELHGTAAAPITIRAADGASPVVNRPNANQNIWDLNAEYVVIRGIHFSGGSAGLRFESASHVTVEDCEVGGTQDVAIRANDHAQTYDHLKILHNNLHDTGGTGEGMYLGCNHDDCRITDSVIANNHVHDTKGPNVSQGDGIEVKEGSYGNVVRDNVIHDTGYPCILTYSTVGNGAANTIERNVMWNCGDNAIQSAADATIRNNIILGAAGSGIAMQPHQEGTPENLVVEHNTVINNGDAIALRNPTGSVVIANNAVYSASGAAILAQGGYKPGHRRRKCRRGRAQRRLSGADGRRHQRRFRRRELRRRADGCVSGARRGVGGRRRGRLRGRRRLQRHRS